MFICSSESPSTSGIDSHTQNDKLSVAGNLLLVEDWRTAIQGRGRTGVLGTITHPATTVFWVLVAMEIRSVPDVLFRPVEYCKSLLVNCFRGKVSSVLSRAWDLKEQNLSPRRVSNPRPSAHRCNHSPLTPHSLAVRASHRLAICHGFDSCRGLKTV